MMKNSKLSKLLVAGVSIAMLTSALAPMAFAEENSDVQLSADTTYTVYVRATTNKSLSINDNYISFKDVNNTESNPANGTIAYTYNVKYVDSNDVTKGVESILPTNNGPMTFDTTAFVPAAANNDSYVVDSEYGWVLCNKTNYDDGDVTNIYSISVADLFKDHSATFGSGFASNIAFPVKTVASAKVTVQQPTADDLTGDKYALGGKIGNITLYNEDTAEKVTADHAEVTAALTAEVTLPTYSFVATGTDKAAFDSATVVANVNGVKKGEIKDLANGASFSLTDSRLGLADYLNGYKDGEATTSYAITVVITPVYKDVSDKAVQLTVSSTGAPKTYKLDEDDELVEIKNTDADSAVRVVISGTHPMAPVDTYNDGLWKSVTNKYGTGDAVAYGSTVKLPEMKVTKTVNTKTVDDEDYIFIGWEVVSTGDVLADGVTPANGTVITDGIFKASDYKANKTAGRTTLSLVAKFLYDPQTTDEPVYTIKPAVKNPNDTMNNYTVFDEKGKKVNVSNAPTTTWADFVEFEGGIFTDDKGVVSYYADKKDFNGKWVVDTTVTGIADGIYFENGVQDTKACGLKKVAGDDSAFVYLVSDGVYKADYQGLWISEDKVWYYLVNGCCQTPADGVYEHTNGWYYNFKDGKMVETNGFELYGKDQYWFDAGECNTTGGARVAEHVDGFFYYVNNGIWDNTFNGELDGHTFVNGFAAE